MARRRERSVPPGSGCCCCRPDDPGRIRRSFLVPPPPPRSARSRLRPPPLPPVWRPCEAAAVVPKRRCLLLPAPNRARGLKWRRSQGGSYSERRAGCILPPRPGPARSIPQAPSAQGRGRRNSARLPGRRETAEGSGTAAKSGGEGRGGSSSSLREGGGGRGAVAVGTPGPEGGGEENEREKFCLRGAAAGIGLEAASLHRLFARR